MSESQRTNIKRIRAPSLDNTALIKANELTLIGRITNPLEQKISALIPALPRKWNLTGRTFGSDLGNSCFLFRFEKEEDLRRVLDNRPYQFAYWMVIIQRWEPVISATFPSMIPFWINIKGLPLHYWHEDMVCRVGQEIGTLMNHELTKTTARVRVLVDGLKPLVKESIVEFDSGEESSITLEYEKLEMHCSNCYSLLHARKYCPVKQEEESVAPTLWYRNPSRRNPGEALRGLRETRSRSRETPRGPSFSHTTRPITQREESKAKEAEHTDSAFQERVDRHGNPFGERTSTKQTRNPPPGSSSNTHGASSLSWREKEKKGKERDLTDKPSGKDGNPLPPLPRTQWRAKLTSVSENEPALQSQQNTPTPNRGNGQRTEVNSSLIPTREAVMEELQEHTRQYVNCSDPVEAAARRQRVLYGDANGQMEEAVIAAAVERYTLMTQGVPSDGDPVTPPPLQLQYQDSYVPPQGAEAERHTETEEGDFGLISLFNAAASPARRENSERPAIKSIIISPNNVGTSTENVPQASLELPEDEETLTRYQQRTRRKTARSPRTRSPRSTPNILQGASTKKRRMSQLHFSPARAPKNQRPNSSSRRERVNEQTEEINTSRTAENPPIRLIPAMSKQKSDFRVHQHRAP